MLLGATASYAITPMYYKLDKYWSVNGGYEKLNLNSGDFDVFSIEATSYPSSSLGWEFSTKVSYGKDYFSFEPVSLAGYFCMIFVQSHAKQYGYGRSEKMLSMLMAVSSAKLPLAICDYVEVAPYWNLFKLTKVYDTKLQITGDVGLQLKLFPLAGKDKAFFIGGFGAYNFAYDNKASDFYGNAWASHIKHSDQSLFRGWSYGINMGIYF